MKTELLWILAGAAALALIMKARSVTASPHAAGKCCGNTAPGYWADVL